MNLELPGNLPLCISIPVLILYCHARGGLMKSCKFYTAIVPYDAMQCSDVLVGPCITDQMAIILPPEVIVALFYDEKSEVSTYTRA